MRTRLRATATRLLVKGLRSVEPFGGAYERVLPAATFAPWNLDHEFKRTYEAIKAFTLVDQYRCYELWTLVEQSKVLEGSLIEVGVWRGGTGALIAKRARMSGIKAPVYLCDTFKGLVKVGPQDETLYRGGEYAASPAFAQQLIRGFELEQVVVLEGTFPDETSSAIADDAVFRFCHIDVDVYQSAKDVMDWVWPRMVVGGIVVYDDYGFGCVGISRHVDEQRTLTDRLIIHNLNGHAVVVKIR